MHVDLRLCAYVNRLHIQNHIREVALFFSLLICPRRPKQTLAAVMFVLVLCVCAALGLFFIYYKYTV